MKFFVEEIFFGWFKICNFYDVDVYLDGIEYYIYDVVVVDFGIYECKVINKYELVSK